MDRNSKAKNDILAIKNVKFDRNVGLRIRGNIIGFDEVIFMVDYADYSPEILQAKEYFSDKEYGQYAICCSDGTYLIQVSEDQVTRKFLGGTVIDPTPKN